MANSVQFLTEEDISMGVIANSKQEQSVLGPRCLLLCLIRKLY